MDTTTTRRSGFARTAGIIGLGGGLLGAVFAAYELATLPYEVSFATNAVAAVAHLAVIVALGGLAALGAAGSGWWGRAGIGVAILGWTALTVAELVEPFDEASAMPMFEIAPLVIGAGMLLVGVAVLRARHWSGWRRIVPLVIGAYVFVVFLPVAIAVATDAGFWAVLLGWFLGYAALGLAVVVEAPVPAGSPERARVA
ncbi:hypothetical protein [Actinomycetospora aeridis]|uniref:DUF998 domain-containing protein n=1 Tax=Actinomycetospora aeridis TaxID=3129231 RepID=A0ABU8NAN1_9PSEU